MLLGPGEKKLINLTCFCIFFIANRQVFEFVSSASLHDTGNFEGPSYLSWHQRRFAQERTHWSGSWRVPQPGELISRVRTVIPEPQNILWGTNNWVVLQGVLVPVVSALANRHIFVESISVLLRSLQRYFGFCRWQILDNFMCLMYLFFRFILEIFSSVKEAGTQFRCSNFSFVLCVFWHLFFFLSFVQKLYLELCALIGYYYSNCCSYWTSHLWPHSGNSLSSSGNLHNILSIVI